MANAKVQPSRISIACASCVHGTATAVIGAALRAVASPTPSVRSMALITKQIEFGFLTLDLSSNVVIRIRKR